MSKNINGNVESQEWKDGMPKEILNDNIQCKECNGYSHDAPHSNLSNKIDSILLRINNISFALQAILLLQLAVILWVVIAN